MGEGKVRLGMLYRVSALVALALVLVQTGIGTASVPTATTVVTNPNFETLAVDPSGVAWGTPTANKTQLWRSGDEGATWTQVTGWNSIGKQPWYITPLQSGALLAAYSTGTNWAIARSADGGATWTTVLLLPCMNPACTLRYTTLTQKSITQGDGYVFLGTYNNNSSLVNTNYIYRSPDDGVTWSVVNTPTTMRHIHGLAFDSSKHRLYAFTGDAAGDGLWYSSDDGSTLQPLCTDYRCIGIEGIISGNSIVFGTDNPGAANHIVKVDANSGTYVDLATVTYPSYSSGTTGGIWLVGETHEAGAAIVSPQIHLYGSSDGGATWSILYSFTIPSSSDYEIHVESVYPNGDVAVDVSGQGTVVLRINGAGGGAPSNTGLPTISGSTQQGQTLSASPGSWSNSPTSFAYQWRRCDASGNACLDIQTGTGSSYALQAADVGSTLRVTVGATNSSGTSSATSNTTGVVTGSTSVSPPVNTSPPTVSGSAQQGQTLSASAGSWSNSPTSFAYQWRRCSSSGSGCTDIASATSTSYTLQAADVGATLRMRVTAANSAGSASADSAQTQAVTAAGSGGGGGGGGGGGSGPGMAAPTSSAAPTITGLPRQGGTLSASTGSWSGNPTGYSYRWSQCDHAGSSCAPIGGATSSSYQVAKADVGSTLRVSVTATNAGGAGTATSAPTAQVSALAPTVLARPVIRGTLRVGKTLLAGGDRWTEALTRRSYTWLRCGPRGGRCVAIAGARSRSYKLRATDLHHAMRVSVTVWTTGGSAKSVSFASAAVRR